jgi:aerobic-type carbon monoxide dehydrogenase small subunit (CoxS/CutS family)
MSQVHPGTEPDGLPERVLAVTVNGEARAARCPDRALLVEFVREALGLKGTHIGCLTGDCGACTLMVDGRIVKSCLMLAASADRAAITTVEGLGSGDALHPLQQAFWDHDGFQCGFCLPGHLFAALDLLTENPAPSDDDIRAAISGNLCRCTGYEKIVDSIRAAAGAMAQNGGQARAESGVGPATDAT